MSNVDEDDDFFADIYGDDAVKKDGDAAATATIVATEGGVDKLPETAESIKSETTVDSSAPNTETAPSTAATSNDLSGMPMPPVVQSMIPQVQQPDNQENESGGFSTGNIYIPPKDEGKMFIGGLNWETTDDSLKNYFSQFGEVLDCTVMRDNATGRSRGFGFLTFKEARCVNAVMRKEHFLDGKIIDPKRAIPREEQDKTAKIFVGGVGGDVTEDDFRIFFEQYGTVIDAQLMMDKDTGRPRGFGFVTFDSDLAVERIVSEKFLVLKGKPIEVKRAEPRSKNGEVLVTKPVDQNQQAYGQMNYMNGMNPAMMAQYWQQWQQYMQQMMQMQGQNMNDPAVMQQMYAKQMQQMAQAQQAQQSPGGGANSESGQEEPREASEGGEQVERRGSDSAPPAAPLSSHGQEYQPGYGNNNEDEYRDRGNYRQTTRFKGRANEEYYNRGRRSRSPPGPRGQSIRGRGKGRGGYGRGGGGYHPYHRN